MSKDENQRQPDGPLAAAVAQAAAVISTALTEYLGRTIQAAGNRAIDTFGASAGSEPDAGGTPGSIQQVFSQYRDALGDLAGALPQVVQRASQEWRVEPGMRLLFRARSKALEKIDTKSGPEVALYSAVVEFLGVLNPGHGVRKAWMQDLCREKAGLVEQKLAAQRNGQTDAVSSLGHRISSLERVIGALEAQKSATPVAETWQHAFCNFSTRSAVEDCALSDEAGTADAGARELREYLDRSSPPPRGEGFLHLLRQIPAQFSDPNRVNLPQFLDEIKHELRRDPVKGLAVAERRLAWMRGDTGYVYELLQLLEHALGDACLREILLHKGVFDAFVSAIAGVQKPQNGLQPAWERSLRQVFAGIGHPLGQPLTVLAQCTRQRNEFIVLDHAHDRVFDIRESESGFSADAVQELEIYGLREGRTYFTATARQMPCVTPRVLPHRIHDAAVGMAVWMVDRREVQSVLDSDPDRPPVKVRAWDMGVNRTPLVLFVVHYRETDIGEPGGTDPATGARARQSDEHYELGLGCFVAPRNDPLAIGMMVLGRLPVSMPAAAQVGREIWGYDKVHVDAGRWDLRYRPDAVTCLLELDGNVRLRVELPRGGKRSSTRIPLFSYTTKFGQLHRNVLTRSGSGETLRVGGHGVAVSIDFVQGPAKNWWVDPKAGGECRSLLTLLYQFGIVRDDPTKGRRAAYSVWTEHMQGEQGPPCIVPNIGVREDE